MSKIRVVILIALLLHGDELCAQHQDARSPASLDARELQAILDTLYDPLSNQQERDRVAAKLRNLGTNCLPLLMKEMKAIDGIEATNVMAAMTRKAKVQAAFEVLASQAKPLLPELMAEFNAGRTLGTAPHALARIGGNEAGLTLVRALTNADPRIRMAAASSVQYFTNNASIRSAAVEPLLLLLRDLSGPARSMAANTLGTLAAARETVVPALLQAAESDPDSVVRAVAIKSIGRFGTNALTAQPRLEKIAKSDPDEHVRKMAVQALQVIRREE